LPAHDLALLCLAARESGKIAMQFWKQSPKVWEKDDGAGPVTEADLAVNTHLHATLMLARPDYGWLSEETTDSDRRLKCDHTFIIDPIDGTRAFIAGEKHFAHSLAVAYQGKVTAAVVFLPAIDCMYCATIDTDATCNALVLRASSQTDLTQAEILANKATMAPEYWQGGHPPFRRNFRASLAYRLCLVSDGQFDGMATFRPTWEWDIAAGSLIAARAGAIVTDQKGKELRFNRPDPRADGLIATGSGIHAQIRGVQM
jgi:myo-inositol-1(or 4)-monophosphatase